MESLATKKSWDGRSHRTAGGSHDLPRPSGQVRRLGNEPSGLAGALAWLAQSRVRSKPYFPWRETTCVFPPLTCCSVFFLSFSILISKLYHHRILMCSFLKAVYHINGSVYRCEYFPCTVICNPLISTSCTLVVHIQFNL